MKKITKKLMALLMAAVMVMAMGITSMAADSATIKIKNAVEGQTYSVYKIFDLSVSDTNYAYKTNSADVAKSASDSGYFTVGTIDSEGYYSVQAEEGSTAEEIIEWAKTLNLEVVEAKKAESTTLEFTGLATGYYYVTTTTGTVVTLTTTTDEVEVEDKNPAPSVSKEANADSYMIGETVTYTVTINARKGAENYIFTDELSNGLTLNENSVQVQVNSSELDEKYYDVTAENKTEDNMADITIKFTKEYLDTITEETDIIITYTATLNDNAVVGEAGNTNTAKLEYGHMSDTSSAPGNEVIVEEKVYTYSFDLVKTDSKKKVLTGAEFELKDSAGNVISFTKVDETYVVDPDSNSTTIEAGNVKISGLKSGQYTLTETKAPEGYNKLETPEEVTIGNKNNDATVQEGEYASGGVQIINQSGAELPSTGGMGTTLIYIIGSILVLGAGLVLITRRRMNNN